MSYRFFLFAVLLAVIGCVQLNKEVKNSVFQLPNGDSLVCEFRGGLLKQMRINSTNSDHILSALIDRTSNSVVVDFRSENGKLLCTTKITDVSATTEAHGIGYQNSYTSGAIIHQWMDAAGNTVLTMSNAIPNTGISNEYMFGPFDTPLIQQKKIEINSPPHGAANNGF